MLHPRGVVTPRRATRQIRVTQRVKQPGVLRVGPDGEEDEPVSGRHGAVWGDARVIVTEPRGVLAGRQIPLGLIHERAHGRLQQGSLKVTTGPTLNSREQPRQEANGAVEARDRKKGGYG